MNLSSLKRALRHLGVVAGTVGLVVCVGELSPVRAQLVDSSSTSDSGANLEAFFGLGQGQSLNNLVVTGQNGHQTTLGSVLGMMFNLQTPPAMVGSGDDAGVIGLPGGQVLRITPDKSAGSSPFHSRSSVRAGQLTEEQMVVMVLAYGEDWSRMYAVASDAEMKVSVAAGVASLYYSQGFGDDHVVADFLALMHRSGNVTEEVQNRAKRVMDFHYGMVRASGTDYTVELLTFEQSQALQELRENPNP